MIIPGEDGQIVIVVVDGLGRKSESVNAGEVHIHQEEGVLHIKHDGDTTYSTTDGKQRWLG